MTFAPITLLDVQSFRSLPRGHDSFPTEIQIGRILQPSRCVLTIMEPKFVKPVEREMKVVSNAETPAGESGEIEWRSILLVESGMDRTDPNATPSGNRPKGRTTAEKLPPT